MPRVKRSTDSGSASLEFATLGLMLMVPLVYLVLTLGQIQAAAFATEGAARLAAREWVRTSDSGTPDDQAAHNIALALADFGVHMDESHWERECSADCRAPGSLVTIRVTTNVHLPLVPPVLDIDARAVIPISGSASQVVPRYRQ